MHVKNRMMLIWKWNKNFQIWEILQNFAIASKFELPRLHGPTSLRIKWCKHTDLSWDLFQILHIWSFNTRPLALGDYSGVFNLQIWKHKLKEFNSNMCIFRKIRHVDCPRVYNIHPTHTLYTKVLNQFGKCRKCIYFIFLLFSNKIIQFSINLWAGRVEREEDCLDESESFHLNFVKFPMTCELWIGGAAPSTSFQPSWRGRDDSNESESFVADLIWLLAFV